MYTNEKYIDLLSNRYIITNKFGNYNNLYFLRLSKHHSNLTINKQGLKMNYMII